MITMNYLSYALTKDLEMSLEFQEAELEDTIARGIRAYTELLEATIINEHADYYEN